MYAVGNCDCGCSGKTINQNMGNPAKDISSIFDDIFNWLDTAKDIPFFLSLPDGRQINVNKLIYGAWIITGYVKFVTDAAKGTGDIYSGRISGKESVVNYWTASEWSAFCADENGNIQIKPGFPVLPAVQNMIDEINALPNQSEVCHCDPCDPDNPPQDIPHYAPDDFDFWKHVLRYMSIAHGGEFPIPQKPNVLPPPQPPINYGSPLILDLNNDGVKTIGVEDGAYFDHGGDRFAEKSGWVDSNDALLVADKNKNGIIDDGNELFGNNSILANGSKAANGFVALAEFDSNRDGIVNKNDERWSELKLWQDKNGDGKIDDGELLTLEEAGVSGLNIRYVNQGYKDENGNDHRQVGSFIRDDGSAGTMTDVWFDRDSIDTEYLDDVAIPDDIKMLPNLKGWGSVRDMHQVMATDETGRLKALMEQYLASDPLEGRALVWDIILAWTGVTDIAPDFYSRYSGDSRMLLAVERLTGSRFGVPDDSTLPYTNFSAADTVALKQYYSDWGDKVSAYLLLSTRYNDLYSLAVAAHATYEVSGETSTYEPLLEILRAIHEAGGESGRLYIADFLNHLGVYDPKSIVCAGILRDVFNDPRSNDEFIRDMSLDWVFGTSAADRLYAAANDSSLCGSSGDDSLFGSPGNDILWGGSGDDNLCGYAGNDTYLFCRGDGNDVVIENGNGDPFTRNVIRLGEGISIDDIEFLLKKSSISNFTDFVIRIKDTGETLTIDKAIYYYDMHVSNAIPIQAITFADGTVWEWADIVKRPVTIMGGSDYVYADSLGMTITGNAARNIIYGNAGVDILNGGDGEDTLSGAGGDDVLHGDGGNDVLSGDDGNDVLYGDAGDDSLNGGNGDDILWGGSGNDHLYGGFGDDIFQFGRGDGDDVVYEHEYGRSSKRNIIRLGDGIGVDDIEFLLKANTVVNFMDFIIRIKGTDETLTIDKAIYLGVSNADNLYSIQAIVFSDGTELSWEDIRKRPVTMVDGSGYVYADTLGSFITGNADNNAIYGNAGVDILHGGAGNDTLYGEGSDDILHGDEGNDILNGGSGNDVYMFGIGDGNDTIYETESRVDRHNVIRLGEGLGINDIELLISNRSGNFMDLGIRIKSTGETLTIFRGLSDYHTHQQNSYSIQVIEFADGTVWTQEDIAKKPKIMGEADLTMYTEVGGSHLIGNSRNNTLHGGAHNDILHGAAGNDSLQGNSGDDVYMFGIGDGNDTIYETESRAGRRNLVRLGEGIGAEDIEFLVSNRSGNHMDLGIRIKSTGETLTVSRGLSDYYTNQQNSYSIQAIEFADGTVWTHDDIAKKPKIMGDADLAMYAEIGGSYLIGNALDNTLCGSIHSDILHGAAGNDLLCGNSGDDVYVFGIGDGNDTIYETESRADRRNVVRLCEGISTDDIEFLISNRVANYMDFSIRIKSTGETLTVSKGLSDYYTNQQNFYSIQAIEFADGTVWSYADIAKQPLLSDDNATSFYADVSGSFLLGNNLRNTMIGGIGDDILYGNAGDDRLSGGSGNDILWGGAGNDRLEGSIGDDVYRFGRGDGHDVVYEFESGRLSKRNAISLGKGIGADDIEFLVKQNPSGYTDFIIRIKDTGETLTIDKAIVSNTTNANNYYSIQAIEFADGTVWEWADIMKRPAMMMGGSSYIYADTLGSFIVGDPGNNTIYGNIGDDILCGEAGIDMLNGNAGNDVLYGGAGDDTLRGDSGNDTLWGGAGNDRLEGSIGDDVYRFGRGDGHDVVYESESGRPSKRNVIGLGEGIGMDDIEFLVKQNPSGYTDLVIRIKDTDETLTIDKAIVSNTTNANNYYSIQAIEFADGTVWEWADIMKRPATVMDGSNYIYADTMGSFITGNATNNSIYGNGANDILYGGDGADTLNGANGNDVLHGDAGNDTLDGGGGSDVLWGGSGNDRLNGGANDDMYLFQRGDGIDTIIEQSGDDKLLFGEGINLEDVWFTRSGNDLVIDILGTEDRVKIQSWFYGANYQVESISAGGMEIVNTQMNQMLQAMAGFGVPVGVDGKWTEEQKEAMAPVLSTYWKPTGS